MIQGTTPTLLVDVEGVDLDQCSGLHVTLQQGSVVIDLEDPPHEGNTVAVILTQEQSLQLTPTRPAMIQINGLTASGARFATDPDARESIIDVGKQLLRKVIT